VAAATGPTGPENEVLVRSLSGAEHIMVTVAGGTFRMGSESGGPDESPVHTVFLSEFLIDKLEVTNQKFALYLNAVRTDFDPDGNLLLYLDNPDVEIFARNGIYQVVPELTLRPVVEVTWWGAKHIVSG
jgi:formylglycine-generating enzyme required for sulfatase activity